MGLLFAVGIYVYMEFGCGCHRYTLLAARSVVDISHGHFRRASMSRRWWDARPVNTTVWVMRWVKTISGNVRWSIWGVIVDGYKTISREVKQEILEMVMTGLNILYLHWRWKPVVIQRNLIVWYCLGRNIKVDGENHTFLGVVYEILIVATTVYYRMPGACSENERLLPYKEKFCSLALHLKCYWNQCGNPRFST